MRLWQGWQVVGSAVMTSKSLRRLWPGAGATNGGTLGGGFGNGWQRNLSQKNTPRLIGWLAVSVAKIDMSAGCVMMPARWAGLTVIFCSVVPVAVAPKIEAMLPSTYASVPVSSALTASPVPHSAASTCASNEARKLVCTSGV